jgi:predicted RNase H-like HicB family nuclease
LDDEPLTADDLASIREGRAERARGETVSHDEVKQLLRGAAITVREEDGYVSQCPELDVASQGDTVEEARGNLAEAVSLFLETADPSEIEDRLLRSP